MVFICMVFGSMRILLVFLVFYSMFCLFSVNNFLLIYNVLVVLDIRKSLLLGLIFEFN